jgi:hypothetical protein
MFLLISTGIISCQGSLIYSWTFLMPLSSEGNNLQELKHTFLGPSFTGFETTTCLFTDLASSGNAPCRKRLSSSAFTCYPVPFEGTGTFGRVRVSSCTASHKKQRRKQPPYSFTHRFAVLFSFVPCKQISRALFDPPKSIQMLQE